MKNTKHTLLSNIPSQRFEGWVYAFILFHIIVWTIAPLCVRHTLPMDALEGTIWGHQLELGYDKNPFMNAWLTALAVKLSSSTGWAIYLFSQLSVGLCFWSVWELGKKILPAIYAFIGMLLLESMQYYNLHAIDLNDNTLEIGLWAVTTLTFYHAMRFNKLRDWLLTGFLAGLCMMTKYYVAMLIVPMLFFMLLLPQTRMHFKRPYFYLAFLVFLIIVLPHTIWLMSHDFVTINYAINRVSSPAQLSNHFYYPLQFAYQQFEVFIPALVLLIILMSGRVKEKIYIPQPTYFDKLFLLVIGMGPFILTLLISALSGIKLRAGWGQPLLTFWGLTLLAFILPAITLAKFRRFLIVSFILFFATVFAYCYALIQAKEPSSANFPGKRIAVLLTQSWHKQFHTPLFYVVGPRWLAGNVAFYSTDHPSVYIDADKKYSPWISEGKLHKAGAIFVWDPTEEHQMSEKEIRARFPTLGPIQIMHFTWLRNLKMTPVEIRVAYLLPAQ